VIGGFGPFYYTSEYFVGSVSISLRTDRRTDGKPIASSDTPVKGFITITISRRLFSFKESIEELLKKETEIWRIVWDAGCFIIVMLTSLLEIEVTVSFYYAFIMETLLK
jgi:hypothetical protein